MIKKKAAENNVARSENSFNLGEISLEEAKMLVKSFGCTKGQWMHRKKSVYDYDGVEWSLVEAVPGIYYYEAEVVVENIQDVEGVKVNLIKKAQDQGYSVFAPEEYKKFIEMLGAAVNKYIDW